MINNICHAEACTTIQNHQIYMSKKNEFTLYHEIGHNLYWDNKSVDNGLFSEQQRIADDFAFYILANKYPNKYVKGTLNDTYKTFYESNISKEHRELFKKTCPKKCILQVNFKTI